MTEQATTPARPVLSYRDFRLLYLGQVVSDFGDALTSLVLLITINEMTGSTAALATMAIVLGVPQVTIGLLAGVFVDRHDRRRIMLASDLLRAVLVLGFILAAHPDRLWLMYALAFAQASVGTFFSPARGAMIPRIIPRTQLLAANSLSQTSRVIAGVLGTGAAGLLLGLLQAPWPAFILDAATFAFSFLMILLVRTSGRVTGAPSAASTNVFAPLRDGLVLIRRSATLYGVMLAMAVSMLALGAVNVLFVPLLANDLKVPTTYFGLVQLAQTVGLVLAGAVVGALAARLKPGRIISFSLAGLAVLIALISLVTGLPQVLLLLFAVGLCVTPMQAAISTIVQTNVQDDTRGRVGAALNAVTSTASLVSMAAAGTLATLIGTRSVFLVAGGIIAIAAVTSLVAMRERAIDPAARPVTA
jgi:MFS family permease